MQPPVTLEEHDTQRPSMSTLPLLLDKVPPEFLLLVFSELDLSLQHRTF